MRTSHINVRRQILEEKQKITDEEFFSSEEYHDYLMDIIECATQRYQCPIPIRITASPSDPLLACTDSGCIYLNVSNCVTKSLPNRLMKSYSLIGLVSHEAAHCLYTDFSLWARYHKKLEEGKLFPRRPTGLSRECRKNLEELETELPQKGSPLSRLTLDAARALANIAEDGYVDTRYSREFQGVPARGIAMNNLRILQQAKDLTEMEADGLQEYSIVLNLLIQLANGGEPKNESGYLPSYYGIYERCACALKEGMYTSDARLRCVSVSKMLLELWPLLKASAEKLEKEPPQEQTKLMKNWKNDRLEGSAAGIGIGKGPAGESDQTISAEHRREQQQNAAAFLQRALNAGKNGETETEQVLRQIAENRVERKMEQELLAQLQKDAEKLIPEDGQKLSVRVIHPPVMPAMKERYRQEAPPLMRISGQLNKKIERILENRETGGRLTGLYSGKKCDARALYKEDGRIFRENKLQTEPATMSVALVLDSSGSMAGNNRIRCSREAAIVLQNFCRESHIPLMVIAHTAWDGNIEIFSYLDFESTENADLSRVMDLRPRDCNHDGIPIRLAAEKLLKQDSDVKLLFIISDGCPNDGSYTGEIAENDLRKIRKEYTAKGIQIVAAAIGEDRERMENIYGRSYLNISDLNKLPMLLTKYLTASLVA